MFVLLVVRRARATSNVQLIKHMFRWAARKGYLDRNLITEESTLKRKKFNRRERRLIGDEEQRLLATATLRMQRLIIGALEMGCRQGELLLLRWRDVSFTRMEITIRAANAKDDENRHIPISSRLKAVLDMARSDPAGEPLTADDHVFGDEVGGKLTNPSKAWQTAVLKANGHTPQWDYKTKKLRPESQAVYRQVNLRFHDLRHEAGSRWLEAGMPLHLVAALLGHANISTTSVYLNATRVGLHDAMKAIDAQRLAQVRPHPSTTVQSEPSAVVN